MKDGNVDRGKATAWIHSLRVSLPACPTVTSFVLDQVGPLSYQPARLGFSVRFLSFFMYVFGFTRSLLLRGALLVASRLLIAVAFLMWSHRFCARRLSS